MKPLFWGLSFFVPKIKKGYLGRKTILRDFNPQNQTVYWFHAASSGEAIAAKPLIEALVKDKNILPLMTHFSPSGFQISHENITQTYLPYDTPRAINRFIDHYKPTKLIVMKWDIWCNMLRMCKKRGIPAILLNADYSNNKKTQGFAWRWFTAKLLRFFDAIYVVSKTGSENLLRSGIASQNIGDLRYNVVQKNVQQPYSHPKIEAFCANENVIVAGSVYARDMKIVQSFLDLHPNYKALIAPHNITETEMLEAEKIFGKVDMLSADAPARGRVLVVDAYGILSSVYRYGNVAFVGRNPNGNLHNILEAAAYNIPLFVSFSAEKEAFFEAEEMKHFQLVFAVKNGAEMQHILERIPKNFKEKSTHFFQERTVDIEALTKKIGEIGT